MRFVTPHHPNWLQLAYETLDTGGIILHPTSTAYGLAIDATNEDATERLNQICKRTTEPYKPYIVLVNGLAMAQRLGEINEREKELINKYWPGPLTLILKKISDMIDPVRFGSTEVAIRHDSHEVTKRLSEAYPRPYTSTSANTVGGPTPYTAQEALDQFEEGDIDLVIDVGELPRVPASTLVDCTKDELVIVRQGVVRI